MPKKTFHVIIKRIKLEGDDMHNKNLLVAPVLKWVGGKRQLMDEIKRYLPEDINKRTYYEPFMGGAAVLFELQPKKAVVNDVNQELINVYKTIRDSVDELILDLKKHENTSEYFYEVRDLDRDKIKYQTLSDLERASRILYLNKTCFNGLFRVNSSGEFNVPYGKYKNPNIVNEITLRAVSNYFNSSKIEFRCGDFEDAIKGIRKNSFVYLDPPYDPVSDSSSFTGYAKGGFGREEQIRLKEMVDRLTEKGVKVMLSNSYTEFILDLYSEYRVEIVYAKRNVNAVANKRGEIKEVLVMNY